MCEFITYILVFYYLYCGEPVIIIAAGLFAIAAEINGLASRLKEGLYRWTQKMN